MKLATFTREGFTRIGIVIGDRVLDLARAAPDLPTDMVSLLEAGDGVLARLKSSPGQTDAMLPLDSVRLEAPILRPRKFLGAGANYPGKNVPNARPEDMSRMRHEGNQFWFNKQVSCINGPYQPIVLPRISDEVVFEPELAVIIGRKCRNVSKAQAPGVIAGYVICNDVTAVDWVRRSPTATLGKSFDTHGPIGPWIVTADEIEDTHALNVRGLLNGVPQQSGNTAMMCFDCFDSVAYLSRIFTLEPGDILTTGSPSGERRPLEIGDVVRCEIDGIGHIESRMVAET